MPPTSSRFQHLPLVLRYRGSARPPQFGGKKNPATEDAKANRAGHSASLGGHASGASTTWKVRLDQREKDNLPPLPKDIPLLLEIDPTLDLDDLARIFGFEIVSEQEDGFVIVASQDLDLTVLLQKIADFAGKVSGSGSVAKIHRLHEDPKLELRLQRLLPPELLAKWPFQDNEPYICDFGIECIGTITIPSPIKKRKREKDEDFTRRQMAWAQAKLDAYAAWDRLMDERLDAIRQFVDAYQGSVYDIVNEQHTEVRLSDSFTVRVQLPGKGLRDFVLNFPFLFDVAEPDEIDLPQRCRDALEKAKAEVNLTPPPGNAPVVCVIDSGIQEEHFLLAPAIDRDESRCFLPDRPATEVADLVRPGGHGTRVAGAILYADDIPTTGERQLPCWLQNARVLDHERILPSKLFPPAAMRAIVSHYHQGRRHTRIFNHSINAFGACRTRHMSAWAAEIDYLSAEHDVLVIQSAGNLKPTNPPPRSGIREHLEAGRNFPDYLCEDSCRVANPAQSLQALTVGSVAYGAFEGDGWTSFARESGHPSAFSRSGLGIWNVIKPEVVEFGGDDLKTAAAPPDVSTPIHAKECYPNLVRSTLHEPGPAFTRDEVGTSFAAPKVTRIAALLQQILPDQSCLLYRALIVQSARWPRWALEADQDRQSQIIRWIGYGVPDAERATANDGFRTTMITSEDREIKAGACDIFQIPIPDAVRRPGDDYRILIEVTLSYVAYPRRTRRNPRRYLSTWLDWKSSRIGESLAAFKQRALKTEEEPAPEGTSLGWTLENNPIHGSIKGVRRSSGTVQKDWAIVPSNRLPKDFCIAVVGHQGWNSDPEASARYALTVSFEILGREIEIHQQFEVEVNRLQQEVEAEVATEAEVNELEMSTE